CDARRESHGVRKCHAGLHAASGSRERRLRSVRRSVRRCRAACARRGRRGLAAAQRRGRSRSGDRNRVSAEVTARIAGSAADIGATAWNACANPVGSPDPNPFTRYEFFAACEQSGSATPRTGWRPAHIVIEIDGRIAGLLPAYLKNHSQGEYVFDHSWADALERAGVSYYPKLQASVPFTPATGRRLLVAPGCDERAVREALLATGATAVRELGASSLHITFMTEEEWIAAGEAGYLQRQDQQFHWE